MVRGQIRLFTKEPTSSEPDATAHSDACASSKFLVYKIDQLIPPAIAAPFTAMQDRTGHPVDVAEPKAATRTLRALDSAGALTV
jgi:hypothetical protein